MLHHATRRKIISASLFEGLESRRLMAGTGYGFSEPNYITFAHSAAQLKLADLNADGKQDLIAISVAHSSPSSVSVFLGNGDGTFQAALQESSVGTASPGGSVIPEVELVDLNQDGKLDLVMTRLHDSSVYAMSGLGNGMFNSAVRMNMPANVTLNPGSLAVGDFNGDQVNDIAVATAFDDPNAAAKLTITYGGALGSVWSTTDLPTSYGTTGTIRAGDFDRDGVSDLAILSEYQLLVWSKLNLTQRTVTTMPAGLLNGVSRYSLDVANLRGPNQPPGLIVGGRSGTTFRSRVITIPDPIGAPSVGFRHDTSGPISKIIPGDFNGDGYGDAVVNFLIPGTYAAATGSSVGLLEFPSTSVDTVFSFTAGAAADLNNDGLLDFVGGSYYNFGAASVLQSPPSLTVTTAVDEDNGNAVPALGTGTSLREAFNYAKQLGGTQTITFAPSLGNANAVLSMTGSPLFLSDNTNSNVTIRNDTGHITINGDGTKSLFVVPGTATLNLRNLNITNFNSSFTGNGGAVYVDILGTLNVENSTFSGNGGVGFGGAIFSDNLSFVTIRNSTFANNGGNGAIALDASAGGTATLENNTIANNPGGGVRANAGQIALRNNIISGNGSADLSVGTGFFSGSNNIIRTGVAAGLPGTINVDPQLNPLGNYGGLTPTMLPSPISPALDAGLNLASVTADQRGIARPQGPAADLGAVEFATQDLASVNAVTTADGALWFIYPANPTGIDLPVYRKPLNGPVEQVLNGIARRLSLSANGTVVIQTSDNRLFMRPGSPLGIGEIWSPLSTATATDGATWFVGPGGTATDGYVERWGVTGAIQYTGGLAIRVGVARDGSILAKTYGREVFSRTGSASGIGTAWVAQQTVTAGDGATWFIGPDTQGAFQAFSIYRWDAGNLLQATALGTSGNAIYTVNNGQIVVRNVALEYYLIPGSESGLGSNSWIRLNPSLTVTTTADELDLLSSPQLGTGTSLREALAYAELHPGADTITFAPGLAGQAITLSQGWSGPSDASALQVSSDVTLQGPSGAGVTLAVASGAAKRHLFVHGGASLLVHNLTFTAGTASDAGGAIYNDGTTTISNSTFISNSAGEGGAIQSTGTLNISTSTFTANSSNFNGGALRLFGNTTIDRSTFNANTVANQGGALISFGNTTITNSTFADNGKDALLLWDGTASLDHLTVAYNQNGGLANVFANTTLRNSIVAGNTGFDQSGTLASGSSNNLVNLSAAAAGLGTLSNNGGPTLTISILPGSSAINAGIALSGINTDQRGIARPQGSAPDIGAYERIAGSAQVIAATYEDLTSQAVHVGFKGDASAVFDRSSFMLTNLTTNQVTLAGSLNWTVDGTAASLVLTNLLSDGNYRMQIGATTLDFCVLTGDFNRDRAVNFDDLLTLAQQYGQAGNSTQGDTNYDGQVNFDDLLALAQRYGTSLPGGTLSVPRARNSLFKNHSELAIASA